ncbi:hypothetical protein SLS57_001714 [Botryosphaeria dothidea]
MNRLLFYTSLGNLFLDTFYFISVWGIPDDGGDKALCRTQGFMIQMFSLSPSMWTTAMAINVYLIVYRKFTTLDLRRLEPWYLGINFGIPFLMAFVLLMLDVGPSQKHIYGPATTLELKRGAYGIDEPITILQVGTPFAPPNHVVRFTEVKITESYREQEEKAGATMATTDPIRSAVYESSESSAAQQDLEKCPSKQETGKQGEAYGTSGSTASTMKPPKSTRWLPTEAYAKISILVFLSLLVIHTPAGANRVYMWHTSGFETLPVTEKIEEETYSSYTNDLYYPAKIGQVLHLQYQVVGKLGYDTTSTVWMCRDLRVFPEDLLKAMALRILFALDFFHSEAQLIHTDLQARNILTRIEDLSILQDYEDAEIRRPTARKIGRDRIIYRSRSLQPSFGFPVIADFGEVRFSNENGYRDDIMPDVYRAPEVVLDMPWDFKVDIWNLGVLVNPNKFRGLSI